MAVDVVEKPSPADLVMFPYREVQCDDTLREWIQVLRLDLVDHRGEVLKVQLLLDRRHKMNKGLSKPVAYFRMTSTDQPLRLANTLLALALVKVLDEQGNLEPSHEELKRYANSHWTMALPDVLTAAETFLRDLRLHRMALEKEVLT